MRVLPGVGADDFGGFYYGRARRVELVKKIICLMLALLMVSVLFAGCGNDNTESSSSLPSVVPTVEPTAPPVQKAKAVRINASSGLNVRATASGDGEILALAEDDSLLPLLVEDPKDGWYQVMYDGQVAYVSAEYAKVEEITLEEYNKLQNGENPSSSGEDSSSQSKSSSSSSSSPPSSSSGSSSSQPESGDSQPVRGGDSEDGE